jgi:hypothetical protein
LSKSRRLLTPRRQEAAVRILAVAGFETLSRARLAPALPVLAAAGTGLELPCATAAAVPVNGAGRRPRHDEDGEMSQRNVETLIGRLVTDEGFRRRFGDHPAEVLGELLASGWELTPAEQRALTCCNLGVVERCARAVDPRLLKVDLRDPQIHDRHESKRGEEP